MKILVICKRYYTQKDLIKDQFGRLYHFPVEWQKSGHQVTVLALNYHNSDKCRQVHQGVDFISLPLRSLGSYQQILKYCSRKDYDIIFASSDQITGLAGLYASYKTKTPLIYDIYDDYEHFGLSRIPFMKYLNRFITRKAKYICTVSAALQDKYRTINPNISIFPNGTDQEVFIPLDQSLARKSFNLDQDGMYIGYTGSIDERFDYSSLIKAINIVRKTHPQAKLLIAGKNRSGADLNKDEIHYFGHIEQDKIPTLIAASDVMVLPYSNHPLAAYCNPCKLSEYLACKKPVVAANISDIEDYLPNTNQSLYPVNSSEQLASQLLKQIASPEIPSTSNNIYWKDIAQNLLDFVID